MSEKSLNAILEAESHTEETRGFIKQVRRITRRKFTPEEKIRIVLEGFRHEVLPLKRPQTPTDTDIANFVLFLNSEVSKNITGEAISVNGGTRVDVACLPKIGPH